MMSGAARTRCVLTFTAVLEYLVERNVATSTRRAVPAIKASVGK